MRALFVLVSLLFVLFALAQTSTKCNPLDASCPADKGLTLSTINYNFTHEGSLDDWDTLNGNVHVGSNGAEFTINKQGEHPTIQSGFAIFYGEVSIEMKASPGTGIVSSLMMESDDRDEIDWVSYLYPPLPHAKPTDVLTNTIYRRFSVDLPISSRPTTSAKVTPALTIARPGPQLQPPSQPSTSTPGPGQSRRSSGPLTANLFAHSPIPKLRVVVASPRLPCISALVSGLAVIPPIARVLSPGLVD